ncbi:hypothetical protein KODAMA_01890 [Serratia phage vB_SmaM-Kodama]|nr:hypothetical protein KODAMA_01890 [Serratia phage vB_SmaM-Kodama]
MYASKALLDLEGIQVLQVDREVNLRTLVSYYPVPDARDILRAIGHPWVEIKSDYRSIFYCTLRKGTDQKRSFMDSAKVNSFLSKAKAEGKGALLIVRGSLVYSEAKEGVKRKVRVYRNQLGNITEVLL